MNIVVRKGWVHFLFPSTTSVIIITSPTSIHFYIDYFITLFFVYPSIKQQKTQKDVQQLNGNVEEWLRWPTGADELAYKIRMAIRLFYFLCSFKNSFIFSVKIFFFKLYYAYQLEIFRILLLSAS